MCPLSPDTEYAAISVKLVSYKVTPDQSRISMTLRILKCYFNTHLTVTAAAMSGSASSKGMEGAEQKLEAWKVNVDMAKLNEGQRRIHAEHLKSIKVTVKMFINFRHIK